MSRQPNLERISHRVSADLHEKGWSHLPTGINAEDRKTIHHLFELMNTVVATNPTIQPETTTLTPRDHSKVLATTREAMSFHTDNVYLDSPCKSVALFCTEQAEEGGSNTLVDGLSVVKELPMVTQDELKKRQWQWLNPATGGPSGLYEVYNEAEETLRWWRMSLVEDNLAKLAVADAFEAALLSSSQQTTVCMQPGDILVTDNTRVVHNRETFRGSRHLYRARFW